MNNQSAFSKFKPLCDAFLKHCSIENIEKLEKVVNDLDYKSVHPLHEYIILPIRMHLHTKLQEKVVIKCINCLSCVFKKCNVGEWSLFVDIFELMISKICGTQNEVLMGCEELKLAVCENISCLVRSSTEEVLNEMYSLSFRLNLGYLFYMLNNMLQHEKSKSLQKAVLLTIGALTYSETFSVKRFKMTKEIASEALASCLPGLSIALQKVACADIKQGYNVIVAALNVLADLIVLVIGDDSFKNCYANNTSSEVYHFAYKRGKLSKNSGSFPKDIPLIFKNESWFTSVSEKLMILVLNMDNVASHAHWKVRFEFVNFTSSLLLKCTKTLDNCIPFLLSIVFALSVDESDRISSRCRDLIKAFSEHFQSTNSTSLNSIIESNIEKLTSEIIRCKISANDDKKLASLRSLQGYVEILGSSFDAVLFSMIHIEKIVLSLITLIEFDTSILNMIEEIPVVDTFDVSDLLWPKKKFKFLNSEEVINTICKICYSLGHIQNSQLLIDYLIDKLSNDLYTLQCIFLIGSLVKGFSREPNAKEKYLSVVSDVLEIFLSHTLFDPPIHGSDDLNTKNQEISRDLVIPNTVINKNILQTCLLLEAVANCAECLGNDFKVHLIKVLCPVMEKAGSSNFIISQSGRLCLYSIAHSCEYSSVNELVKDNADYITNILLINFNACFYKPEIAVVLSVAVQQCDSEALVLFRDLIYQILNSIDYNQDKAYFLMLVLFSVVASIKKWFPSKKGCLLKYSAIANAPKSLRTTILEYKALKKMVHDMNDEVTETDIESSDHNPEDYYSTDETKPEVPLHINITCEIFKRCVHLQSSENVYFRMLTLETVELCIAILRDYESQLHPLIHEFWNPFLRRFLEESFISKAFNILLTIVNECGDFVRHRTFKDVMPKLVFFLKKEYSKSHIKYHFRNYQHTKDHSLQLLILSEIGFLCTKLDIDYKDICEVANVCLPYLRKDQPQILQDAALRSLSELATLDADAIWFYWNVLYCEDSVIVPLQDCLPKIYFPHSNGSLTEIKNHFDQLDTLL